MEHLVLALDVHGLHGSTEHLALAPRFNGSTEHLALAPRFNGNMEHLALAPQFNGNMEHLALAPRFNGSTEHLALAPDDHGRSYHGTLGADYSCPRAKYVRCAINGCHSLRTAGRPDPESVPDPGTPPVRVSSNSLGRHSTV